MKFNCTNERLKTKWSVEIKSHVRFSDSYFIHVEAEGSRLEVYFLKIQTDEWIVAVPNHNCSTKIGGLRDNVEYNAEKIGAAIKNEKDGHSIAQALYVFAKEMNIS